MLRSILFLLLVGCCSSLISAQEPGVEKEPGATTEKANSNPNFWMKKKLEYSQIAFQSLVQGDFDAVGDAAAKLGTLNKVEAFVHHRSPKYRAHLEQFRLANEALAREAEEKNIEGVTLAFHQLTHSCVMCHRGLRDAAKSAEPKK